MIPPAPDAQSGARDLEVRPLQNVFTLLIALQFLLIVSHDLIDVRGLTHGSQVRQIVGRRKLWLVTLANGSLPGFAVVCAIVYWHRNAPLWVASYWAIYCGGTVLSAILMWYVPYFLGADAKRQREVAAMYAGTWQLLPPRGENPRPNALHLGFHVLFVANLLLALVLVFENRNS